jgi:hypothetical protein
MIASRKALPRDNATAVARKWMEKYECVTHVKHDEVRTESDGCQRDSHPICNSCVLVMHVASLKNNNTESVNGC